MARHPGLAVQQLLGEFSVSSEGRQPPLHRPPSKRSAGDGRFPDPCPPARARPAPGLTCGLLQKSLPVSNGLVHILLPVHNFLVQSLDRKVNWS